MNDESCVLNQKIAGDMFPDICQLSAGEWQAAKAPWSVDGLPVLGPLPLHPGIFVVSGGNGFSLAPLYSELLVSMVLDQEPSFSLSEFNPSRFFKSYTFGGSLPPD